MLSDVNLLSLATLVLFSTILDTSSTIVTEAGAFLRMYLMPVDETPELVNNKEIGRCVFFCNSLLYPCTLFKRAGKIITVILVVKNGSESNVVLGHAFFPLKVCRKVIKTANQRSVHNK